MFTRKRTRTLLTTLHARPRAQLRRLAYGRPRQALEPHRPAPWLFRGLAWCIGAIVAVLLGAAPLLALVEVRLGGLALGLAAWLLLAVMVCTFLAVTTRPTPLVLRRNLDAGDRT